MSAKKPWEGPKRQSFMSYTLLCPTTFSVSKEVPNFCKHSNVEERRRPNCMLSQGAKGPPWKASCPHPQPLCLHIPSSRVCLHCCLGKSVPFCPEHCPEHPLPSSLSGAGNFTQRDFAPCVSRPAGLSMFVQWIESMSPSPIHCWVSEACLPLSRVMRIRGRVRLLKTARFPLGKER